MNRLFEALSEMEPVRRVADADPLLLAPIIDAQPPACCEADALRATAEAAAPEPLKQELELAPADSLTSAAKPAFAEPQAEPDWAGANVLPEDVSPSPTDMASLILVLQAEMDQMAVTGISNDLGAGGPTFTVSETQREPESAAVAIACPEFAVSELPFSPLAWEMEVNLASIELQFITADCTDERSVSSERAEQTATASPAVEEASPETSLVTITIVTEPQVPSVVHEQTLPEDIFPSGMPSLVLVLEPENEDPSVAQPANTPPSAVAPTICEAETVTELASPEEAPAAALPCEPPVLVLEPENIIEQFALDFSSAASLAEITASAPDVAPAPAESSIDATSPSPAAESTATENVPETLPSKLDAARRVHLKVPPESRLVALTEPDSLGAEKFRALVTRLEHQHRHCDLKSFQVTSSVISEGKTLVSGNVAVTLARHLSAQTLLVEGDLHRPTLATILGLDKMRGLNHWWSGRNQDLSQFIYKVDDLPLWFLPAGKPCERPSDVLRSARFGKAFQELASEFEWTVVDSTPMVPIVDVNLWSRLVDGTLLVVREGVTAVKALKQGLLALDHPNLIGMVLNDATATGNSKYDGQYYGSSKRG